MTDIIANEVLTACGWNENQLKYLGTMVHNVVDSKGNALADVISSRNAQEINVEWYVPNREGDKVALNYSTEKKEFVYEKSDSEINNTEDVQAFLNTIKNTIKNTKGDFFSTSLVSDIVKAPNHSKLK